MAGIWPGPITSGTRMKAGCPVSIGWAAQRAVQLPLRADQGVDVLDGQHVLEAGAHGARHGVQGLARGVRHQVDMKIGGEAWRGVHAKISGEGSCELLLPELCVIGDRPRFADAWSAPEWASRDKTSLHRRVHPPSDVDARRLFDSVLEKGRRTAFAKPEG